MLVYSGNYFVERKLDDLVQEGRIFGAMLLSSPEGIKSSAHVEGLTLEEWYLLRIKVYTRFGPWSTFGTLSYRNKSNST